MLVYFMAIWSIIRPFGIFCCHLVYFSFFDLLFQEKYGNTESEAFSIWSYDILYFSTAEETFFM
jgi:hypothetical protein